MEFIEYPKALYRGGEYVAVADADDEAAHRAADWTDWPADHARTNEPAAPVAATEHPAADPAPRAKRAKKAE